MSEEVMYKLNHGHKGFAIKTFIITELTSLGLFYILAKYLVVIYGAEGVVLAHLYRYIIYFFIVIFAVWAYFKTQNNNVDYE